jgi:hypothetical protein
MLGWYARLTLVLARRSHLLGIGYIITNSSAPLMAGVVWSADQCSIRGTRSIEPVAEPVAEPVPVRTLVPVAMPVAEPVRCTLEAGRCAGR